MAKRNKRTVDAAAPRERDCGIRRDPENRRERFLSAAEPTRRGAARKGLEESCEAGKDPRRQQSELPAALAAVRLLVFTGVRVGEIREGSSVRRGSPANAPPDRATQEATRVAR